MKTIETSILINAPISLVWDVLTDFDQYDQWNPFIRSIEGNPLVGQQLEVLITPPKNESMRFKPQVLVFDAQKEFRWKGKLFISGLFDGEHYFQVESTEQGSCLFTHGEHFSGLLVGLFGGMLQNTAAGFQQMNRALKSKCEMIVSAMPLMAGL